MLSQNKTDIIYVKELWVTYLLDIFWHYTDIHGNNVCCLLGVFAHITAIQSHLQRSTVELPPQSKCGQATLPTFFLRTTDLIWLRVLYCSKMPEIYCYRLPNKIEIILPCVLFNFITNKISHFILLIWYGVFNKWVFCFVTGSEKGRGTLDALLCTTYCRSQLYLSRQLSQLHPELTMPMFSGKLLVLNSYIHS